MALLQKGTPIMPKAVSSIDKPGEDSEERNIRQIGNHVVPSVLQATTSDNMVSSSFSKPPHLLSAPRPGSFHKKRKICTATARDGRVGAERLGAMPTITGLSEVAPFKAQGRHKSLFSQKNITLDI